MADKPEDPTWEVRLPNGRWCYVQAPDRSRARAEAKVVLRLKGRVPVDTEIKRL